MNSDAAAHHSGPSMRLPGSLAAGDDLVCTLPDLGVIEVTGEDAATFLHAQLTSSVTDLEPGGTRLAAWCSPKGRVLALFRVVRTDGGFVLLTPRERIDALLKRLRLFVLRAKVTLADRSETLRVIGLAGGAPSALLEETVGTRRPDGATIAGDLIALPVATHGAAQRHLLIAPENEAEALWARFAARREPAPAGLWTLLDIQAGIPEVVAGAAERHVPQMLNLDLLDGLSYTKGCYPGQEVVARMHYLGKLKRRLFRVGIDAADLPEPGAIIRLPDGGEAGEIVSAAGNEHGRIEALAVMRLDAWLADTPLTLEGATVERLTLPYAIPEADGN